MSEHLWLHFSRPRPNWYEADRATRTKLETTWAEIADHSISQGARRLGAWAVRGQHDYSQVEAWLFRDADDLLAHWQRLVAAGYPEWFATSNTLGAPNESLASSSAPDHSTHARQPVGE